MSALLEQFRAAGIAFAPMPGGRLHATGPLSDTLRTAIRKNKRAILASLAATNDNALRTQTPGESANEIADRWLVHFVDHESLEVILTNPATHATILARYPTAVAAEPFWRPYRVATADEASELRKLISTVLPGDLEGQREALDVALADVEAALVCFRALAATAKPSTSCSTCRNRRHPGTAEGCVERHDLEPLFGLLRRLPADRGAACTSWRGV
jgi:hypothetical protein